MLFLCFTFLFVAARASKLEIIQCQPVMHASDLRQCFRIQDVRGVVVSQQHTVIDTSLSIEGFLYDPEAICKSQEKYAHLFDCLSGSTSKCFDEETARYVPDAQLTAQGLEYICQHFSEIDSDCYNQTYSEVFSCARKLSSEILKEDDSISTKACTSVDIIHDCIKARLMCGEGTRDIVLKFQDENRKPIGCPSPERQNRQFYVTSAGASNGCTASFLFVLLSLLAGLVQCL